MWRRWIPSTGDTPRTTLVDFYARMSSLYNAIHKIVAEACISYNYGGLLIMKRESKS